MSAYPTSSPFASLNLTLFLSFVLPQQKIAVKYKPSAHKAEPKEVLGNVTNKKEAPSPAVEPVVDKTVVPAQVCLFQLTLLSPCVLYIFYLTQFCDRAN